MILGKCVSRIVLELQTKVTHSESSQIAISGRASCRVSPARALQSFRDRSRASSSRALQLRMYLCGHRGQCHIHIIHDATLQVTNCSRALSVQYSAVRPFQSTRRTRQPLRRPPRCPFDRAFKSPPPARHFAAISSYGHWRHPGRRRYIGGNYRHRSTTQRTIRFVPLSALSCDGGAGMGRTVRVSRPHTPRTLSHVHIFSGSRALGS